MGEGLVSPFHTDKLNRGGVCRTIVSGRGAALGTETICRGFQEGRVVAKRNTFVVRSVQIRKPGCIDA